MVVFTNFLIPKKFSGYTILCFALVRPEFKYDVGLVEHEKTHVKQFWKLPFIHGILYRFSKKYRLSCEVEAYREQSKHYDAPNIKALATRLVEDYGLDLGIQDAIELLKAEDARA